MTKRYQSNNDDKLASFTGWTMERMHIIATPSAISMPNCPIVVPLENLQNGAEISGFLLKNAQHFFNFATFTLTSLLGFKNVGPVRGIAGSPATNLHRSPFRTLHIKKANHFEKISKSLWQSLKVPNSLTQTGAV